MASSGSVFSETLQNITDTKLNELSVRRDNFEKSKAAVISSLDGEKDPIKRLGILTAGVKHCFGISTDAQNKVHRPRGGNGKDAQSRLEIELANLDRFLAQARHGPSVSLKILSRWETSLLDHLNTRSVKFQYADLYGQLVTEWLGEGRRDKASSAQAGAGTEDDFHDVGNAAKLEARMAWEKTVFQPANVDQPQLLRYLTELFGLAEGRKNDKAVKALQNLQASVKRFEIAMSAPDQFNPGTLSWTIRGLLASNLLPNEQREVLQDFENNPVILDEIADVLNMRMGALGSWTWGPQVALEQRRKISGIYDVTMQEDLVQAIFLQYIGVKWSVFIKGALRQFVGVEGAWDTLGKPIPSIDQYRMGYYLGDCRTKGSLQEFRQQIYHQGYFMAQLPETYTQLSGSAEGEEEAEYSSTAKKRKATGMTQQRMVQQASGFSARVPARRAQPSRDEEAIGYSPSSPAFGSASPVKESYNDGNDDIDFAPSSPIQRKQNLLHLLSTEVVLNTAFHDEITAFHSVFETWNPLLPHSTILHVLRFFGVSDLWQKFFRTFLKAPLKFSDDDQSVAPRLRQRGTPAAHVLSDFFGESVLFCLDLAVNHATEGQRIWRIHDDLWFWSPDHDVAVKAWRTIEKFAAVTGASLDERKTGSVRISGNPDVSLSRNQALPEGDVRWGFLRLSPTSGRFEIDQTMVDSHIKDLRTQLRGTKSVLSFIQAWNTYAATFFSSNFGKPANCYGVEHVDNMLATHQRIQKEVFSQRFDSSADEGFKSTGTPNSVVEHLRQIIHTRFAIPDAPDGYFFFPVELGGLDLKSPFVTLLQIRDSVLQSPSQAVGDFLRDERRWYELDREKFIKGRLYQSQPKKWEPQSQHDKENFMPFEEYVRYREDVALRCEVKDVFRKLLRAPVEVPVEVDPVGIEPALKGLGQGAGTKRSRPSAGSSGQNDTITDQWDKMEPYWKWVASMYGPEIVDKFGGLRIVDAGLLPMGMVKTFREKRLKWEV